MTNELSQFRIDRISPRNWRSFRGMRIRFVEDHPKAIAGDPAHMKSLPLVMWKELTESLASDPDQAAFIAWEDRSPVGFVNVQFRQDTSEVAMTHLWVRPESR